MSQQVSTDDATAAGRLHGKLGVVSVVFMVIAAAAPLTVVGGNVPLALGEGPGSTAPIGFLIAAAVLLIFSVGFTRLTPFVQEAGAFFSYVTLGVGPRAGLGTAFVALLAYTAIQVGVYGYAGWTIGDLVQHYGGPELSWWVWAFVLLALVAALGYRNIDLSAKVLGVALVLEIAVVLVMNVAIIIKGGDHGLSTVSDAGSHGPMGIAILFALTGFIGYEATAVFRDEAKDPERTVPRATYIAVLVIGLFYAFSCWAMVQAWGPAEVRDVAEKFLASGGNMMFETSDNYAGTPITEVMRVLLVSSTFACVLSFHNILARYQFTLARLGVMPAALAKRHPTHHSPSNSSLVQTVTAAIFVAAFAIAGATPLVEVFGTMAGVATIGMILLMVLTSIAVVRFFLSQGSTGAVNMLATVVAPVVAGIGLLGCAWLVIDNIELVTGVSGWINWVLILAPPVAFVIGAVIPLSRKLHEHGADEPDHLPS